VWNPESVASEKPVTAPPVAKEHPVIPRHNLELHEYSDYG
jgi:hypothetical protein